MALVLLPGVLVYPVPLGQAVVMPEVRSQGWLSQEAKVLLPLIVQAAENCVAVGARVRRVEGEAAARIV